MQYIISPYAIAQLVTGAVSVIVAFHVWQRRASRGSWPLFMLFVMVSEWALANGMEAAAVSVELKIFWSKITYLGAQASPVMFVLFAQHYTGKGKRISALSTALLFLIPLATIILAATNEAHGLIWKDFIPGPAGTNSLIYIHGPAFWVAIAYIFVMVSVGSVLLVLSSVRSQQVYRKQHRFLLCASILPWAGFMMYILNLNPFPGLEIISISFLFTGLVLVWGMNKSQLMDIVPIARELIIENVEDGILVVDDRLRVIDINPAAEQLLSIKRKKKVGTQIQSMAEFWEKIQDQFDRNLATKSEITCSNSEIPDLGVRVSPLSDHRKKFLGWAIIVDDISIRKKAENDLSKANCHLKKRLKEIQELQQQLREQALRDPLTGVYNRRYLDETLSRELTHAERGGYPMSIIMLDIDNFKKVNDTYGHKIGDDVIMALGRLLQSQSRNSDCVSRYGGGDEFVLMMPEMSRIDAFIRAELWREAIKAMFVQVGQEVVQVTISLGIATYPEDGIDSEALMKSADDALYMAKENGRNRTCVLK